MSDRTRWLLAAVGVAALAWAALSGPAPPGTPTPTPTPTPAPPPKPPPQPTPCPPDRPCPRPRALGWPLLKASVGGPIAPDGTEVQCDLPPDLHLRNRGGSDGSGLCVFCSMTHSGRWQNDPAFSAVFEWMWGHPGGGYPEKVDRVLEELCRERRLPRPRYLQAEGSDLDVLRAACRNGLMPAVTYSYSPSGRYHGARIAHMVSLVHADDHWFGVLDNNYPQTVEWLSPDEFLKTYTGGRSGWAVILLSDGPPPPPRPRREEACPAGNP